MQGQKSDSRGGNFDVAVFGFVRGALHRGTDVGTVNHVERKGLWHESRDAGGQNGKDGDQRGIRIVQIDGCSPGRGRGDGAWLGRNDRFWGPELTVQETAFGTSGYVPSASHGCE